MKKVVHFLLIVVLTFSIVFSFSGCFNSVEDRFPNIKVNQNVAAEKKHVQVDASFNTKVESNGYYNSVVLSATVKGYSQLTYYNVSVAVTFTAIAVTDNSPSGEEFEHTIIVPLNNKGRGNATTTITLDACRSLNNKKTSVSVVGSVTKIKATE